ncbi:hypothetical protein P8C59_001286 [Phyllachora maydis]|uniref:cyclin-dependent kinase n=1 Tax=Phyllachora maydis TaxID=1825666 RepID=A0AAD9HY40_9PEZI|nr:hypothetical protein P8C59_001286 [Phyllachora maydis]
MSSKNPPVRTYLPTPNTSTGDCARSESGVQSRGYRASSRALTALIIDTRGLCHPIAVPAAHRPGQNSSYLALRAALITVHYRRSRDPGLSVRLPRVTSDTVIAADLGHRRSKTLSPVRICPTVLIVHIHCQAAAKAGLGSSSFPPTASIQRNLPPDLAKSKSVFFRKPGNESVVGSGTYGKVFKGLNVYTQKLVALKRIRMEGERDGFPVTAVREVKLLRSLKHINVVKLQEVMVEANECFMVFEYLSHDLTGLLNHPTFQADLGAKKDLAMQLFESLKYLHTRGVLHRDIKAANILVSSEGVLKLADFGLARFYEKNHQLDYTNRVITIWYRSPELLLGETRYGPAVDIWSAACVMHEIFTKTALFPGDGSEINQLERIYEVLGTPNKTEWPNLPEMPWFELLRPGYKKPNVLKEQYKDKLPGSAFELLASMLQYDPDKRPTATQVLQHPYFTSEEPAPRRATELKDIKGDWHEFESKALRREKERKEKERRAKEAADKQGIKDAAVRAVASGSTSKEASTHGDGGHEKDRKRPHEAADGNRRDAKRAHVEPRPPAAHRDQARERQRDKERDRDRAPASAAEVVTAGKA